MMPFCGLFELRCLHRRLATQKMNCIPFMKPVRGVCTFFFTAVQKCFWHKGFLHLSPLPHFRSFGLLQKITTITVTVNKLCVLWFISAPLLHGPDPSPPPGLHCLVSVHASEWLFNKQAPVEMFERICGKQYQKSTLEPNSADIPHNPKL